MSVTDMLNKIETTFEGWHKPMPHLPDNGRKWIATNVWWMVIIGLVLSALATISSIGTIIALFSLLSITDGFTAPIIGSVYSSFSLISAISIGVSILSSLAVVVLAAMAISPLRDMNKKGWNLLFASSLLSILLSFISNIINFSIFSLIPSLVGLVIGLAISMYFLFEIRTYFMKNSNVKEIKVPKVPKVPQSAK